MQTYSQHSCASPETSQNTQVGHLKGLFWLYLCCRSESQDSGWVLVSFSANAMASATWSIPVVFPDWGKREVKKDPSPSTQADVGTGPPSCIAEMKMHTGETLEINKDKLQRSQLCKIIAPLCPWLRWVHLWQGQSVSDISQSNQVSPTKKDIYSCLHWGPVFQLLFTAVRGYFLKTEGQRRAWK